LQLLDTGVVSHCEELIKIREGTALSVRSLVNFGLAAIQTNKHSFKISKISKLFLVPPEIRFVNPFTNGSYTVTISDGSEEGEPINATCIARNARPEPEVRFYLGNDLITNSTLLFREPIEVGDDKPTSPDMFSFKDSFLFVAKVM
jgi:hypothetical protein